ncbi:MAG: sulfite exporter TauE/SafE family protein [Candidatus Lokiarchaeota archaeon]|nr:sulfite exporter TauE/SafE family protein [Candidatus Lokiarchaeota archaeon]
MILFLSLTAIFISSMVQGIIGFGNALVLIPIITPIIGIRNAVILTNIWGTFPALLNFIKYHEHLDRAYFYRFIALGVPATIFATYLVITIRLELIELIFGIFVLTYSSLKLIQYTKYRNNPEFNNISEFIEVEKKNKINSSSPVIYLGGFSYGLFTGLISAAGPLNVALLEKTGHYRENFIGNFAATGTVLSISRIPFYFIEGGVFPYDLLFLFVLALPLIFLGTILGHKITPKIPVIKFQIIIFCFLLGVSLKSIITSILSLFFI